MVDNISYDWEESSRPIELRGCHLRDAGFDQMADGFEDWPKLLPKLAKQVCVSYGLNFPRVAARKQLL